MIRRAPAQVVEREWIEFPGGELEGTRPRALCPACREKLEAGKGPAGRKAPLCFQCYRVELDRDRALTAAGQLDTASEERFQSALPFEPVNRARLERLRADRTAVRAGQSAVEQFVDKRRRAQIAARHALQRIAAGLQERDQSGRLLTSKSEAQQLLADSAHAAEMQLPDAWLPFVLSR